MVKSKKEYFISFWKEKYLIEFTYLHLNKLTTEIKA